MIKGLYDISEFLPDEIEGESLSEEEIIQRIPELPSSKLADLIVAQRYLGMYAALSKLAMEELAKRRGNNDSFAYEQYINEKLVSLPKLKIDLKDFGSLLGKLRTK